MNKSLEDFDLTCRFKRYQARKAGFDIPKQKPGVKTPPFWDRVEKSENGCWIWTGDYGIRGYGTVNCDGTTKMAHRHAWEITTGELLGDRIIRHNCDNSKCVRPDHLIPGTQAENIADKVARDRQAKGEGVGSSVLTERQVVEARKRYKFRKCTYAMLAEEMGVTKDTMQKAIRGINWGHINA